MSVQTIATMRAQHHYPRAFTVTKERVYDLAASYEGPSTVMTFEFEAYIPEIHGIPFVPDVESEDLIAEALEAAIALNLINEDPLRYTIEQDFDSGTLANYRVTLETTGEPEEETSGSIGPGDIFAQAPGIGPRGLVAVVLVIAIALALATAFVATVFYVITGKNPFGFLPNLPDLTLLLGGAVVIVGGLVLLKGR